MKTKLLEQSMEHAKAGANMEQAKTSANCKHSIAAIGPWVVTAFSLSTVIAVLFIHDRVLPAKPSNVELSAVHHVHQGQAAHLSTQTFLSNLQFVDGETNFAAAINNTEQRQAMAASLAFQSTALINQQAQGQAVLALRAQVDTLQTELAHVQERLRFMPGVILDLRNAHVTSTGPISGTLASVVDGHCPSQGTMYSTAPNTNWYTESAELSIDMGSRFCIDGVAIEADSNDRYLVTLDGSLLYDAPHSTNCCHLQWRPDSSSTGSTCSSNFADVTRKCGQVISIRAVGNNYYGVSELRLRGAPDP